ncbi:MAG: hypothetical protein PHH98_02020 [Candidatus Gracilibacteria bacterium]|nr:hypothetical protein [Candidatus Gracilibacteria bacterium]
MEGLYYKGTYLAVLSVIDNKISNLTKFYSGVVFDLIAGNEIKSCINK